VSLAPGTRLGPYEIIALIGAGGMGEVYRARDAKLNRDVAIKVLPDAVALDADRLARFTREAQVLASLNHPNIAAIYGIEQHAPLDNARGAASASRTALVLELVDGEDLADHIARGPMPLAEVLPIARQVADALEAAHELGIVHRDLKPANIKLRVDGTAKVLDFGLAKAIDPAASSGAAAMNSPTMTARATQMGMIIGTAAYMSPEQARGRAIDKRADIWAFGAVLFEMLTGTRAFTGGDVSETLAAVLKDAVDFSALPVSTPPRLRALIARCLERDVRLRLRDIGEARVELARILDGHGEMSAASPPGRASAPRVPFLAFGAAVVLAAFALGWAVSRYFAAAGPTSASATTITEIPAPLETISAFHSGFALSPDGETLVFAARRADGVRQLWIRQLSVTGARPLPGTEGGAYPFWSPNGNDIAFFANSKLRRVPVRGGDVQTICDAFYFFPSGSWSARDEILLGGVGERVRIAKVPASGGTPAPIDALGDAIRPMWLPDGRRFLYASASTIASGKSSINLAAIDGGPAKVLLPIATFSDFSYAPAGSYLLVNRNDVLTAQKLDLDAEALTGPVVTIAGPAGAPNAWLALSSDGDRLAGYVRQSDKDIGGAGDPWARLQWVNRQGAVAGTLGTRGRYWSMAISPTGRRVAINPSDDIWIMDGAGRTTRITSDPETDFAATWSPDESEVLFRQPGSVWRKRLDVDDAPSQLPGVTGTPTDWSRDRRWAAISRDTGGATGTDISLYDFETRTLRPWLATPFTESMARFSPDGRWIAYASDSSGRREIYVRTRDGSGAPIPVSTGGGIHPRWRGDGRELFFLGPADEIMAVDVIPAGNALTVGSPRKLFAVPLNDISVSALSPYDVTSDGQRFLLNVPDRPEPLFFLQGLDAFVNRSARGGGR
jgi:Tol biopolymer transport system component